MQREFAEPQQWQQLNNFFKHILSQYFNENQMLRFTDKITAAA